MKPKAVEKILDDLFVHNRGFLPGKPCSRDQVVNHLKKPILLDGLTETEAALVLSTLPHDADQIYLSPLDKGLSGSKVFSAKYDVKGDRVSKLFVMKIGQCEKIKQECDAIEEFVSPHIPGVAKPIIRNSDNVSLLVQELAGLSANANLTSLKDFVRKNGDDGQVIERLLVERLGNWYLSNSSRDQELISLSGAFNWYLTKVDSDVENVYPSDWEDLKLWTSEISGREWKDSQYRLDRVLSSTIQSPLSIVHGDLHSQNVLIDERGECWPIDFAWCHDASSPLIDIAMLECSLKFLAIPQRSDLRTMIAIEARLCEQPTPSVNMKTTPYRKEIGNVLSALASVRAFAFETLALSFADYLKVLSVMTYCHASHPKLNRPYVLASLQILLEEVAKNDQHSS